MRLFVTGATGFIGASIVQDLLRAGHQVRGLCCSDQGAVALRAAGAEAYRGDLADLDALRRGIEVCDGVIHTAFSDELAQGGPEARTQLPHGAEADRRTVRAMGAALAGSSRPLVVTSTLAGLPTGRLLTEAARAPTGSRAPGAATEAAVDTVAAVGVRVAAVRLPPAVYGPGDGQGVLAKLVRLARTQRVAAYLGQGANTWPAAHCDDVARLYRLAVEQVPAPGTRFHAVAEQGVGLRAIAERIGQRLRLPVESRAEEDAHVVFGAFAYCARLDVQASGQWTQQQLGWLPTHPALLAELDSGSYFPA